MHHQRREKYWNSNSFVCHMFSAKELAEARRKIHSMRPSDLAFISRLELRVHLVSRRSGRSLTHSISLVDKRGLWRVETSADRGPVAPISFYRVITESYAQSLEHRPARPNLGPTFVVAMKDQVLLMLQYLSDHVEGLADIEIWRKGKPE